MVIRVRVVNEQEQQQQERPPVKRRRAAKEKEADRYTDIAAHKVVLCSQSPYFDRCMGGGSASLTPFGHRTLLAALTDRIGPGTTTDATTKTNDDAAAATVTMSAQRD